MFKQAITAVALFALTIPAAFGQGTTTTKTATGGPYASATGILVSKGQAITISSSGTMTMTYTGGGFLTCDPYGDIITSPTSDSPAYAFFSNEPPPLEPPGSGKIKFPSSGGLPQNSASVPYGGLEAGISPKPNAGSAADFPNGFFAIGGGNAFDAPITGYLYLAINTNTSVVASGTYTAMITISGGGGSGGGTGNPVVETLDPDPELLGDNYAITTDLVSLATEGEPVTGVAADGVAQVVIRVSGVSAAAVPVVVLLDENYNFAPNTGEDGTLTTLNGGVVASSSVVVPAFQKINGNSEGFVVYKAPPDFTRKAADQATASRAITILAFDTASNTVLAFKTLQVVRPPVLFVHGLWGDPGTWDQFDASMKNSISGLVTYRADFESNNGDGVGPNTLLVLNQAYTFLSDFKSGYRVAASQFDFIVHSMGGLISDTMPTQPRFKSAPNYGHGVIHKLITFDTPYLGSPLATSLDSSSDVCKAMLKKLGNVVGGAVHDLNPNNPFLQSFNAAPPGFPKHAVASYVNSIQSAADDVLVNEASILTVPCHEVFITYGGPPPPLFTFTALFATFTDPYAGASDLIVSEKSQLGPYSPGSTADTTSGLAHSHFVLPFLSLALIPGSLDKGTGSPTANPDIAVTLLNASATDPRFVQ